MKKAISISVVVIGIGALIVFMLRPAPTDSPTLAPATAQTKTSTEIRDIDFYSPTAQTDLQRQCDAQHFYSCTRLGQYHEVMKHDLVRAVASYERACQGHDELGCEWTRETTQKLCYELEKSDFCGKFPPEGEYRVIAFLETLDPSYQDAFAGLNLEDNTWRIAKTHELWAKRIKERNPIVLSALEHEKATGNHDGADAEQYTALIRAFKGEKDPGQD